MFIFSLVSTIPATANAGLLSALSGIISGNSSISSDNSSTDDSNSQNVPLLHSSINFNASAAIGGGNILVVDNDALISDSGPSGTLADVGDSSGSGQISKYMVQKGDTLSLIAKMFGVSVNTIIWANNITGPINPGDILVILPVSGTIHTVVKGDTLESIATKYKADADEIAQFNGLADDSSLNVGDTIIIPNGEGGAVPSAATETTAEQNDPYYNPYRGGSGPRISGYYIRPLVGGVMTQGLHGYNAVDIGTPQGTPLLAAASGEIIVAKSSGWNGGYGDYVVISHPNGTQTLYGHMSKVIVSVGEEVVQGQVIGLSGETGLATGPHLHFEVRGAYNFMLDSSEY